MANKITIITNRDPVEQQIISASSRYVNSDMIYYGNLNCLTFKTYKRSTPITSADDRFMIIKPGMAYRPDRASQDAYGVPDFWWKIMEYNNMKDIMEFKTGVTIMIPANPLY